MNHSLTARQLRAVLRAALPELRHGHALDLLAAAHGQDNWNVLAARPDLPPPPQERARAALSAALAAFGDVPDEILDQAARLVSQPVTPPWTLPLITGAWQAPVTLEADVTIHLESPDASAARTVNELAGQIRAGTTAPEAVLPGLHTWPAGRERQVTGPELLTWLTSQFPGGMLVRFRTCDGNTPAAQMRPDRPVPAVWACGEDVHAARVTAARHVRRYWRSARWQAAARRALRLLNLNPGLLRQVTPTARRGDTGRAALLAALLILTDETDRDTVRETLAAALTPPQELREVFAGSDDPAVQAAAAALGPAPRGPLAQIAAHLQAGGVTLPARFSRDQGHMDDWTARGCPTGEDLLRLGRAHPVRSLALHEVKLTADVLSAADVLRRYGVRVVLPAGADATGPTGTQTSA